MPRFFFHFTSQGDVSRDEVGTEFPSLEAAYLDSCQSALEMSIDKLRVRDDPTNDSVEIADESGRLLMNIPFSEVLRPQQKPGVNHRATAGIIQACERQVLRSAMLRSELQTEFEKTQSALHSIHGKLTILKGSRWPD
jgi:Domain of unknown function (DUF6894)